MKNNYFLVLLIVICIGVIMISCEKDFLSVSNPNQMTVESFWRNADDVESALIGTYALLQHQWWNSFWGPGEFFMTLEVMSDLTQADIFYPIGDGGHDAYRPTQNMYTTSLFWRENYQMLFAANQVIEKTPDVKGLTENQINSFIAEAKFLRAYAHFQLLQLYGNIVMVTEVPKTPDDFYRAQSTPEQVYNLIEQDLIFAKQYLPVQWPAQWLGRAARGAAASYLGKVYLFQEKWSLAAAEFEDVTTMGYSLVNDMYSLFNGLNEHSSESIFEINYSQDRTANRRESQSLVPNFESWLGLWPSNHLKNLFTADTTADGQPSVRKFASIVFDHPNSDIWYFDGKTFSEYFGDDHENIYYKKYSYYDSETDQYNQWSVGSNFVLMRYADVLLMLAEARNELGQTAEAAALVNQVRSRAGTIPINESITQFDLRYHIREVERPLELCNEMGRFFDLVRWHKNDGGVQAALQQNNAPNANNFIDGVNEIWPIHVNELNANPNIIQNPGY